MEQNSKVIKKVTPINLKMLEKCGNNKQLMISKLMNAIGKKTQKKFHKKDGKLIPAPKEAKIEKAESNTIKPQIVIHSVEILPSVVNLCDVPDPEPLPVVEQTPVIPVKKLKANPHSVQSFKPSTMQLFTQKIPQKDPNQPIKLKMKRVLVKPKLTSAPRPKFMSIQRYDKPQTSLVPPIPSKKIFIETLEEVQQFKLPETVASKSEDVKTIAIAEPENPSEGEFFGFLNDDDEILEQEQKLNFFNEQLSIEYSNFEADVNEEHIPIELDAIEEIKLSAEKDIVIQIEEIPETVGIIKDNDAIIKNIADKPCEAASSVPNNDLILHQKSEKFEKVLLVTEIENQEVIGGIKEFSEVIEENTSLKISQPDNEMVEDKPASINPDEDEIIQEVQDIFLLKEIPVSEDISKPPSPVKLQVTSPNKNKKKSRLLQSEIEECQSSFSQEVKVPAEISKKSPHKDSTKEENINLKTPVMFPDKCPDSIMEPSVSPEESPANQLLRSENEFLKRMMKTLITQMKNSPIGDSIDVDELSSFLGDSASAQQVPVPMKAEEPEKKVIIEHFSYNADESGLDTSEICEIPVTVKESPSKNDKRVIKITSTPKISKSSELPLDEPSSSRKKESHSSPTKSFDKQQSSKSSHSKMKVPETNKRNNLSENSAKSVELPVIKETVVKSKSRNKSPDKQLKPLKPAESPKIEVKLPDKASKKSAESSEKTPSRKSKESTKALAIPEEELFSSPDLLVPTVPINKQNSASEVDENKNETSVIDPSLSSCHINSSSSSDSIENYPKVPDTSSDDEKMQISIMSRTRKRVRNISASSASSQDRNLFKRVVKKNHLNSQRISSSTDDLSALSTKSKADKAVVNGGSSSDSGMIRVNYINKADEESGPISKKHKKDEDYEPEISSKKNKKPTKRRTPRTRIRSPERVAEEQRQMELEIKALQAKTKKIEMPKLRQTRGVIFQKMRTTKSKPSEKKSIEKKPIEKMPKVPKDKIKRKRQYRPRQRDPNDAERFLKFQTRIKEETVRVFPDKTVPYTQLVAQSRLSHVPANERKGMSHIKFMEQDQEISAELMQKLVKVKKFRCGKCLVDVEKDKWKEHLAQDGYTSWLDEFELPFKLTSYGDCLSRLLHLQKIFRIDEMKCPKCDGIRKSPLGYLSHLYTCKLSVEEQDELKIQCKLCNEKIFPFNITLHKKKCAMQVVPIVNTLEGAEMEENHEGLTALNSSGRLKRKAVRRAEKKMKKIIDDQDLPIDFVKTTNHVSTCTLCRSMFSTLPEALNHVETEHKSDKKDFDDSGSEASFFKEESSDSDGTSGVSEGHSLNSSRTPSRNSDSLIKNYSKKKKQVSANKDKIHRKRNPARKIAIDSSGGHETEEANSSKDMVYNFFASLQRSRDKMWSLTEPWTREMNKKLDSPAIYNILKPEQSKAHITTPNDFMRTLQYKNVSPKFSQIPAWRFTQTFEQDHRIKEDDWKQTNMLENSYDVDAVTMFVGGGVTSLDWAPKIGNSNDYLAVACNNTENQTIGSALEKPSPVVIQIWQFQGLDNNKLKLSSTSCKFAYLFSIENGPVLCVKFCPSPPTGNCIGLLAVTTSIGEIQIFSLPKPESKVSARVLNLPPCATLKLDDSMPAEKELLNQASKVTWNKDKGNNLLAAGYIRGMVAVWDLSGFEENEKICYPVHVIQAHLGCVTAIDFHFVDQQKLLMTCSLDRRMKVFSIAGILPVEVSNHVCKSSILCAEWWSHWTSFVLGTDICFSLGFPNMITQPHDIVFKTQNVINSDSSVMDLSLNNWLNTVLMVSESGDVFGFKMPQLVHFYREKEQKTNELLCSYTDLAILEEEGSSESARLVFCDLSDETITTPKYRHALYERSSLLRINQVRFNNNENSHRFYALGYEAGFVRIKFLKHLEHHK